MVHGPSEVYQRYNGKGPQERCVTALCVALKDGVLRLILVLRRYSIPEVQNFFWLKALEG